MLEEMKEFSYLGYVLSRGGGQESHVRQKVKKVVAAMGQVWGIGKKKVWKGLGEEVMVI